MMVYKDVINANNLLSNGLKDVLNNSVSRVLRD